MTLLLFHAYPLDERMWARNRLPPARHAPRLYGLGDSIAAWARAALAQVEGEVAVVGASMGGYCALEVARQAPERVRALALVGSRAGDDPPERREGRKRTFELIETGGAQALWEDMEPKLFSPHADAAVVARARELALTRTTDELDRALEAIRDRDDVTDAVRDLDVPVLVALGDDDPYFSVEEAEALTASLRHPVLHVFQRCGHLPNLERPDEFDRVVGSFLASV